MKRNSPPSLAHAAEGVLNPLLDPVDEELAELPAPRRTERAFTLCVLGFTALCSLGMALTLRSVALYAVSQPVASDLGDLRSVPSATLAMHPNRYIAAKAWLGSAGGIRYERPLVEDSFRLLPVPGREDVWVEVRVPAGEKNARFQPPKEVLGRLVPMDEAGLRHRGLGPAVADITGRPIPSGAWLVVDGEGPSTARWAAILLLLFGGFAVWNVGAMLRLVLPIRMPRAASHLR